jgi:uncharacterized membrane-anchored protein
MSEATKQTISKVPVVTLGFWVIKILATTLGETGGDAVTMTLLHAHERRNWGYLIGVALFGVALVALVVAQILAKRFHSALYWATIVASTTFGTALADFADRSYRTPPLHSGGLSGEAWADCKAHMRTVRR